MFRNEYIKEIEKQKKKLKLLEDLKYKYPNQVVSDFDDKIIKDIKEQLGCNSRIQLEFENNIINYNIYHDMKSLDDMLDDDPDYHDKVYDILFSILSKYLNEDELYNIIFCYDREM